jgi:hypothetical protein
MCRSQWYHCTDLIYIGYLMLGISTDQRLNDLGSPSKFQSFFTSGPASPLETLRFFASGCPSSAGSFVGTLGRLGISSSPVVSAVPLALSSVGLSSSVEGVKN